MSEPIDCQDSLETYLYNQPMYLETKEGNKVSFYAHDTELRTVLAKIHLVFDEATQTAISLPQSPFGSFVLHHEIDAQTLSDFISYIVLTLTLTSYQVNTIRIHHFPTIYAPALTQKSQEAFLLNQFYPYSVGTTHSILIDELSLVEKMHVWEKRKLRKCQNMGFTFKILSGDALISVYQFIESSRKRQNRQLSLSLTQILDQKEALPDAFHLFAVYHQNQMIAAAITIEVSSRILYTFYYADLQEYRSCSSTVMLLEGIYQFCQRQQMKIMDLGTSNSDSVRQFKGHMGGIAAEKVSWELQIHNN